MFAVLSKPVCGVVSVLLASRVSNETSPAMLVFQNVLLAPPMLLFTTNVIGVRIQPLSQERQWKANQRLVVTVILYSEAAGLDELQRQK